MDAELKELVNKFQTLQRDDAPKRINERNVVEIVAVLQRRKKFVELVYTADGKEFLTVRQLRREILDELAVNGGRINIVDIPASLNVDLVHIERAIPFLISEDATLRELSGELISQQYLDGIVKEAVDALKERGYLQISGFASQFQLTTVFVTELLQDAVNSGALTAISHDVALYTPQFVRGQKIRLQAALIACERPTSLSDIATRHDLSSFLLPSISGELDVPGRVDGVGSSAVYHPHAFEKKRLEHVRNMYLSSGFVPYAQLSADGVGNPKVFMLTCFNPPQSTTAAASLGKKSGKRGKAAKEKQESPAFGGATAEFPNAGFPLQHCFLSDKLLSELMPEVEALDGKEMLSLNLAEKLPHLVAWETDGELLRERIKKLFPSLEPCFLVGHSTLVHSSVFETLKPLYEAVAREDSAGVKAAKRDTVAVPSRRLLLVTAKVLDWSIDEKEEELHALVELWKEPIDAIYAATAASASQNAHTNMKKWRADIEAAAKRTWSEMCVLGRGAAWSNVKLKPNDAAAINKGVLQGRGAEIVRAIVAVESVELPHIHDQLLSSGSMDGPANMQALAAIVNMFPAKRRDVLHPLLALVNGKSVDEMDNTLQSLGTSGEVAMSFLHALNKKSERDVFSSMATSLERDVTASSFTEDSIASASLFSNIVSLLVIERFRVLLNIPGKSVGAVIDVLQADGLELDGLAASQQHVVAMLTGKLKAGSPDIVSALSDLDSLREKVLRLRSGTD